MDIDTLQKRLAGRHGRDYWRCLDELAATPEFSAFLADEFPRLSSLWERPLDRRSFLRLSAAAMAMAGVAACGGPPPEQIVPYVRMPEQTIPGRSRFYATTLGAAGPGVGVLVETREGRPFRIEGNALHPASLGALDVLNQAEILSLYDPDRSRTVLRTNQPESRAAFQADWSGRYPEIRRRHGRGLAILTTKLHSPSAVNAIEALLRELPEATWYVHDPLAGPGSEDGAAIAYGRRLTTRYDLSACSRVLSLDADFLASAPGALRYARDYADARAFRESRGRSNRLYVIESLTSVTGAKADHRRAVQPSAVANVARHLARRFGIGVPAAGTPPVADRWLDVLARDLDAHRGRSAVIAGDAQPAAVHALAHAMNQHLGNVGTTVLHGEPCLNLPQAGLPALVEAMLQGSVDTLVIIGSNPVYTAPADVPFRTALKRVRHRVHWGRHDDETARFCNWHVPAAHELESWGDLCAFDGTVSPVQPVVRPLYNGVGLLELLADLRQLRLGSPRAQLLEFWRERSRDRAPGAAFEHYWKQSLSDGVFAGTAVPPVRAALAPGWIERLPPPAAPQGLELRFAADPAVADGSLANNAWLQELPKPLTKIVWGNALLINPVTAGELGIDHEALVEVRREDLSVTAPAFWQPGVPRDSVTLHLGYGRERAGRVGSRVGTDAYRLRQRANPWFAPVTLRDTGRLGSVVTTQHHHGMEGRSDQIAREVRLDDLKSGQSPAGAGSSEPSLYPAHEYDEYAWGMVIDINACIGCNACVIACQAENNIPTVGPDEVRRGREMHWLRVDRYYQGAIEQPKLLFQPVPCMHCEKAPCEYVCPVHATTHSSEGVNEMTYNRCIGTRFCSQNCPYKVRRFNFFEYAGIDAVAPTVSAARNPEVTVRSRGVMEKCSYCIQRINGGRIAAQKQNRAIRDGEVRTACQDACPTRAIVFGNLNDPDAHVTRLKQSELEYTMLAELNTRPRTTYLAGIRNPNPDLENGEEDV